MTAVASRRPRLSPGFIRENQRRRLLDGAARATCERGYLGVTVTDIVRAAGVARNTFYENFASKSAILAALLTEVCPQAVPLIGAMPGESGVGTMAVEIAARVHCGESVRASEEIVGAGVALIAVAMVKASERPSDADQFLAQLPPGRHGLPKDFVRDNQRRRLLYGTAVALVEDGWPRLTIARTVHFACVSRRTFYEHFDGAEAAVLALVEDSPLDRSYAPTEMVSGLAGLLAECVAELHLGERPERRLATAAAVLDALSDVHAEVGAEFRMEASW